MRRPFGSRCTVSTHARTHAHACVHARTHARVRAHATRGVAPRSALTSSSLCASSSTRRLEHLSRRSALLREFTPASAPGLAHICSRTRPLLHSHCTPFSYACNDALARSSMPTHTKTHSCTNARTQRRVPRRAAPSDAAHTVYSSRSHTLGWQLDGLNDGAELTVSSTDTFIDPEGDSPRAAPPQPIPIPPRPALPCPRHSHRYA
jgi:hypothetical protein